MTKAAILVAALTAVVLCCFSVTELGTPGVQRITGGYYFCSGVNSVSIVDAKPQGGCTGIVVAPNVIDADWDARFIVVKQLPSDQEASHTTTLSWYIIDTEPGDVYGPLSFEEYWQLRQALRVPFEVQHLNPEDDEWEAYRRDH